MSLFKAREFWSTRCGHDEAFSAGCISLLTEKNNSNLLIVGSLSGMLRVFQPAPVEGNDQTYGAADLLLETQMPFPILQVAVGSLAA